eukprot:CAMPEP_0184678390 /NCGR_PEP_ID=MMETSP0312-20130426/1131_1 /TAXON_ID=31354 /ORGANISM="Compsopogon coeruleus, Strain SAG 36.94" /LENGTH=334 /DNA_ID=CAMNT_0027127097 /DNA_START=1459 /DNA_END=2463 /DNA_ORIENTATION=+
MVGTSKLKVKKCSKTWLEADELFSRLELPSLLVEAAIDETLRCWDNLAVASLKFGSAMKGVVELGCEQCDGPIDQASFPDLLMELQQQLGQLQTPRATERMQEAKRLLAKYCEKIRELQNVKQEHAQVSTEAEYYRLKVDAMRESLAKRKKNNDLDSEKLRRNEEKLRTVESRVCELEEIFLSGARTLLEWQGAVWDRVVVGYIIGLSAMMESNPFRGLATSVNADFGALLFPSLDLIAMNANEMIDREPIPWIDSGDASPSNTPPVMSLPPKLTREPRWHKLLDEDALEMSHDSLAGSVENSQGSLQCPPDSRTEESSTVAYEPDSTTSVTGR